MKLYYSPGACSLAAHIVAREAGLSFDLAKVDLRSKKVDGDGDFTEVNPKGYVPALALDDGQLLTEANVVCQFLADQNPAAKLAPAPGSFERYRLIELLAYISTEIHKTYSPMFKPDATDAVRAAATALLERRYALLEERLASQPFLLGEDFSVADAYLFVVTSWARFLKVDLSNFPKLLAFQARVAERPAVQAALKAEGLLN